MSEWDADTWVYVDVGDEEVAEIYGVIGTGWGGEAHLVIEDHSHDDEDDDDLGPELEATLARREAALEAPITGAVETIEGNVRPVVRLHEPGGGTVAIDVEVAPVISALRRAGWRRTMPRSYGPC